MDKVTITPDVPELSEIGLDVWLMLAAMAIRDTLEGWLSSVF